jgi:hypothetical protein
VLEKGLNALRIALLDGKTERAKAILNSKE